MAKILMVIAPEGFQDHEYQDSKQALEENGHTVTTASTTEEAHGKFGAVQKSDILLSQAHPEDYNAIAFIGGPGSPIFFEDQTAHNLASAFLEAGKPTAAICAAPAILAKAGLLANKTTTCHPSVAEILKEQQANYTGNPVEQDGLIITADGPTSAYDFGLKINEALQ